MNRLTQGVIMAVIGVMVITATLTGLYLNFVKEIAALHHGEVRIDNLPERGLCATLTLPLG